MQASFVHLLSTFVVLLALTVALASFCVQRVYYRIRTRAVESVDTMNLRSGDWFSGIAALIGLWLTMSAFGIWREHHDWLDGRKMSVAHTIEVGNIDSSGTTTFLVYRGDERLSELREQIIVTESPKFTLDVSIVRFSNLMKTIGQVDVLKVGAFNNKDQLPERGGASWPFVVRVDHARIETPDNLRVGQVLKIMVNAQGALEARDVSEN